MRRTAASSASWPKACTNTPSSPTPCARTAARQALRSRRQTDSGAGAPRASAKRTPRSKATQHSALECTKCRGSPRHSHRPRSGSHQVAAARSTSVLRKRHASSSGGFTALVPAPAELEQLAQRVALVLQQRGVAHADRTDAAPAGGTGKLGLEERR